MSKANSYAATIQKSGVLPKTIDDVVSGLDVAFCDVTGFGDLEWVEVEDAIGQTVHFDGPVDLLSIQGRVRSTGNVILSDYRVVISKHTDNGVAVVGGRLKNGVSSLLELAITPLESVETKTQIPKTYASKKASQKQSTKQVWANAMDLSATLEKKGKKASVWSEGAKQTPKVGDVVAHKHFGDCQVVKMTDEHVSLQKPDGRVVQLGLRILDFSLIESEDGKGYWSVNVVH